MAEQLKNIYNKQFYNKFGKILEYYAKDFKIDDFNRLIFDDHWEAKELKARMNHSANILAKFLPQDYKLAVDTIIKLVDHLEKSDMSNLSLTFMFIPAYIEIFGINDFENSIRAIERVTQFTSCEFAVRPFYIKYPEKMIEQTIKWANHPDYRVRRLASEGCRPRLPWAMSIPDFKKNPAPVLKVLEKLKNDQSEWVRKSVANNLNDICKDNPEIALQTARNWQGISTETDWLIKHGLRTLLKQGNIEALKIIGYENSENISLENFTITTPVVKVGEDLKFEFSIVNNNDQDVKIRVEYAIYFKKANGKLAKKVFKISEKEYKANSTTKIIRKQSFKIITTRKLHLGDHQLSIILNGKEYETLGFDLID